MSTQPNPVAGAGAGSSAESTVLDTELEPGASPTPEDQGGEPSTTQAEDTDLTPKPGESQEDVQAKEDGRVIPQWMRALKDTNPEAYKKAKGELFELRDRRAIHPTAQAAREEHDLIQSIGGSEGLRTIQEDAQFFKTAANQFLTGNPAFIEDLWEEDPIAAALHVQPMLDTFRTRDIEGYKSTVARLWEQEFKAVNFGGAIKSLLDAVNRGDKKASLEVLNSFVEWYDSIGDTARKAEDPRVKTLLAERTKQLEGKQETAQKEFLKTYQTDAVNTVVDEGGKIFDSFFKNRQIPADDRNDLLREALAIANRAVLADKSFAEQRDKHLERGDSYSAIQLTKARYARELPEAVKRVARRYGLISGSTGTPQGKGKGTGQQPNQPRVEQGWTAVSQRPSPEEIDRDKTTNDMIIGGRAVLKNGKKVDWSKLKQQ